MTKYAAVWVLLLSVCSGSATAVGAERNSASPLIAPWQRALLQMSPHVAAKSAPLSPLVAVGTQLPPSMRKEVQTLEAATDYNMASAQGLFFTWRAFGGSMVQSNGRLIVGAPLDATAVDTSGPSRGAAFVFEKSNDRWQLAHTLTASDGEEGDTFGTAVATSDTTIVVGAASLSNTDHMGAAYVYERSGDGWTQTQKLEAPDGALVLGGTFGNIFGYAVAIQDDVILVGAPWATVDGVVQGAVYVYAKSNGVWTLTQKLVTPNGPTSDWGGDMFGVRIAMQGSTAIIGAWQRNFDPGRNNYSGAAYIYTASNGVWSQSQMLDSCLSPDMQNMFGSAVALQGNTALVGAPAGYAINPFIKGAVCVYENIDGAWGPTQTLQPPDLMDHSFFGEFVALQDDKAVISAAGQQWGRDDQSIGALYLYEHAASEWTLQDEIVRDTVGAGSIGDFIGQGGVAFDGTAILAASRSADDGRGAVSVFDVPASAGSSPSSLALALTAGASSAASLQVANVGSGAPLIFNVDDGSKLSQSGDSAPVMHGTGPGQFQYNADPVLIGTLQQSWIRRFYFDDYPQVGPSATVSAVDVGIESGPAGVEFQVNLYKMPHDVPMETIDLAQLTQVGGATATSDGSSMQLLTVPVSGTIDDTVGQDLVVELGLPTEIDGLPAFWPASDVSVQSHLSLGYLGQPGAWNGIFEQPWFHLWMNVHLDPIASGIGCASQASAPWLRTSPTQGSIDAGASRDLAVSVDATGLAPGHYSTQLCVASKGPLPSMMQVPVDVTVTAPADPIFKNGFDGTSP